MSKVPEIFKSSEHQKLFDRQGFVKIQFAGKEVLDELEQLFYQYHDALPESGFISDSYSNDIGWKQEISEIIKEKLRETNDRIFKNYTAFGGSFLFKMPSENSHLDAHQDWTIVDEERYVAVNCWFPLCDTDSTNGTLYVLPGSHYPKFKSLRAPTIPFFFRGKERLVLDNLIPISVKRGEAIILNQSLIHYSPPNRSDKIRIAITSGLKTKDAPMLFHYMENEIVRQFQMPENFLVSFTNFAEEIYQEPNGVYLDDIEFDLKNMSKRQVKDAISYMRSEAGYPMEPRGFLDRIKHKLFPA